MTNSVSKRGGIAERIRRMTDTNLLMSITIIVFIVMYLGAIIFLQKGFLKPQTLFNIMNANAALLIMSCGLTLVMITGGIDISVGGVAALVSMSCAVYLDYHGGNIFGGLSGCVSADSAVYRNAGGHVLRTRYDDNRAH